MTKKNTFEQGVPQDKAFDQIPLAGGVSTTQGVPRQSKEFLAAQGEWRGVAMPGPGMAPENEAAKCAATTKKGNPCKAYAIKDSTNCIGHNK